MIFLGFMLAVMLEGVEIHKKADGYQKPMGFLQHTASNFKVENPYPVKMEDCSTLQIDTAFSSETLVTYMRLHGFVCQRTILFKAKTTFTCFEDRR